MKTLYWSGLGIVVGSHWMLLTDTFPPEWMKYHAPANLAAAGMIVLSSL
jgi:hypothetical protein